MFYEGEIDIGICICYVCFIGCAKGVPSRNLKQNLVFFNSILIPGIEFCVLEVRIFFK